MNINIALILLLAIYIILISFNSALSQEGQYLIQAFFFVLCLGTGYSLRKYAKKYCKTYTKIYLLTYLLLFTLMMNNIPLEQTLNLTYYLIYRDVTELINKIIIFNTWIIIFKDFTKPKPNKSYNIIEILRILFLSIYLINGINEIVNRNIYAYQHEYQIQLGLELLYFGFFSIGILSQKKYTAQIKQEKKIDHHDPFDDDEVYIGQQQENEINYFEYFILSLLCAITLISNTIITNFIYERTNYSYLRQSGILVFYVTFISTIIKVPQVSQIEVKKLIEIEKQQELSEINI